MSIIRQIIMCQDFMCRLYLRRTVDFRIKCVCACLFQHKVACALMRLCICLCILCLCIYNESVCLQICVRVCVAENRMMWMDDLPEHSTTFPPLSQSWPLLLLYVWHAALKPQLRGTALSVWGILYLYMTPLHISLFLSASYLCSLTLFPNYDSTEP